MIEYYYYHITNWTTLTGFGAVGLLLVLAPSFLDLQEYGTPFSRGAIKLFCAAAVLALFAVLSPGTAWMKAKFCDTRTTYTFCVEKSATK